MNYLYINNHIYVYIIYTYNYFYPHNYPLCITKFLFNDFREFNKSFELLDSLLWKPFAFIDASAETKPTWFFLWFSYFTGRLLRVNSLTMNLTQRYQIPMKIQHGFRLFCAIQSRQMYILSILKTVCLSVCLTGKYLWGLRPSTHWVHTTWIDKVSPSPLPHLITDPSLALRVIHATPHTESMRFVRHSCRFMSWGLSVHAA